MAMMLGRLYQALRTAGVPDDQAREAAEEVADFEKQLADLRSDVRLIKWITGTTLAAVVALLLQSLTV